MNDLFIIPARKGSKGLPEKNTKELGGRALIEYSIDFAREFATDDYIFVSTDDDSVIDIAKGMDLDIPVKRPAELAKDGSTTYDVLKHALQFYKDSGKDIDRIILLQPTSPFRKTEHLREALNIYDQGDSDAVISVKITDANPYYLLFEENKEGFLKKSKDSKAARRQDVPEVYEINGSIYVIKASSLMKYNSIIEFPRIKKMVMEKEYSVDIDDAFDFEICRFLLEKKMV